MRLWRAATSSSKAQRLFEKSRIGGQDPALWIGFGIIGGLVVAGLAWRTFRGRTVSDVMIEDVLTITPAATLREAAALMRQGNVGMLPVVTGGRLQGVITDRDIVVRAIAFGVDPATTRVTECATTDPVAARPDWEVEEAMQVMADCQIGRLPVVDEKRHIVGVVTLSSLALRSRDDNEALETAQQVSRRSARASA